MDNLTHTLAGAALGEAGLARLSGLGMAALVVGANLPDIDVVALPLGHNLTWRRGWSHGPVAMLVLPLLLTAALVAWDRWQARRGTRPADRAPVRAGPLFGISLAAVLSHPAMDWLNTYGVRLLMPFSDEWLHGDGIFIIDPWIWLVLGTGVGMSRRMRRRPGVAAPRAARAARIAVGAVAAYVAVMLLGSRHAHALATRHMIATTQRVPRRVMAGPVPLDPTRRELIIDMGTHYRYGSIAWRPGPRIAIGADTTATLLDHPAALAVREEPAVRDFLYWSRFPFFSVDGASVTLHDARFSRRPAVSSSFSVRVARPATD